MGYRLPARCSLLPGMLRQGYHLITELGNELSHINTATCTLGSETLKDRLPAWEGHGTIALLPWLTENVEGQ